MAIHTIRLRAPWQRKRENDHDVWHRVFGCPSNLSPQETVRLVLRSETVRAMAVLNGEVLGKVPADFNVTGSLAFRNRITLTLESTVEADEEDREPPFSVWLEIESA